MFQNKRVNIIILMIFGVPMALIWSHVVMYTKIYYLCYFCILFWLCFMSDLVSVIYNYFDKNPASIICDVDDLCP